MADLTPVNGNQVNPQVGAPPMGGANAPVIQATVVQPTPAPTPTPTPTPVPAKGLNLADGSDASFLAMMNNLNTSFQQTNTLIDQKNAILHASMGNPVDPKILANLPPDVQNVIQSGNNDAMRLFAGSLNDTINGNSQSVASSIQYLTQGYENTIKTANEQKQAGLDALMKIASTFVDPNTGTVDVTRAGKAFQSLYPNVDMSGVISQLQGLMPISEYNKGLQYGSSTSGFTVTIPPGSTASQTNNPLNIKYSDTMAGFGAKDSGVKAQDGGSFSSFQSAQDGLKAGINLLKSGAYSGMTIDAAMKKWSNGGYGGEVSPSLNANQTVGSLSDSQLQQLTSDMAKRESGAQVTKASDIVDPVVQSYVDGMKNGTVTSIASVPQRYKSLVSIASSNQNVQTPLGDRRWVQTSNGLIQNYIALPEYTLVANALPYLLKIDAGKSVSGSVSDQDLLDSFTKLSTAGGVITDAQISVITKGASIKDSADVMYKKFADQGGILSDDQRQQIYDLGHAVYKNLKAGFQPIYDAATAKLEGSGVPKQFWTLPDLNTLSSLTEKAVGDSSGSSSSSGGGSDYEAYLKSIGQ